MTSLTEIDLLFAHWNQPFNPTSTTPYTSRMKEIECELRQRLANNDSALTRWLDNQHPKIGSAAREVLQRAISRTSHHIDRLTVDACLGFCPVTIVLTTSNLELPKIDVNLFKNTQPQRFIEILLANGLADGCNVFVDPLMYPLPRIAGILPGDLPPVVKSMVDAAKLATAANGSVHCCISNPNYGIHNAMSIAGGRVIGSLLIPVLFFANDLDTLPDALNGKLSEERRLVFERDASQVLTVALGRWGGVRIDFIVSSPRLILDAILESASAHCETAAYWASRAAIDAGGEGGAVVFNDTPDDLGGLSIGFEPGQEVECNFRAIAMSQEEIDTYAKSFANGAYEAGMTSVITRMHRAEFQHFN